MRTTIHEEAKAILNLHKRGDGRRDRRFKVRQSLRQIAREAIELEGEVNTRHLRRDYRPGIGSGRTAHWCDLSYIRHCRIARALHDSLGLSGRVVSELARALNLREMLAEWNNMPEPPAELVAAVAGLEAPADYGALKTVGAKQWQTWWVRICLPLLDEQEGRECVARRGLISGYLAASILAWREGRDGYEGCSGCSHYRWIRQHPETWDGLMTRAPHGSSGPGWEQVYPHEVERAEACRARGWHETLRLNDSVWTERLLLAGERP